MPVKTIRRAFTLAPATAARLAELAQARGLKEGEIIRDALAIFSMIERARADARKQGRQLAVLLDRGDHMPAELVIPD
jgi:predicted transcriptional regulator